MAGRKRRRRKRRKVAAETKHCIESRGVIYVRRCRTILEISREEKGARMAAGGEPRV